MGAGLIRPHTAYDVSVQADGSIRLLELVENPVYVVRIKRNKDGTYGERRVLTQEEISAAIRADRDRQIKRTQKPVKKVV